MRGGGNGFLSGHETFRFVIPWLKKGYDAVRETVAFFCATTPLPPSASEKTCQVHPSLVPDRGNSRGNQGRLRCSDLGSCYSPTAALTPYLEIRLPSGYSLQIAGNRSRATTWFWPSAILRTRVYAEALTSALFK